MRAKQAIIVVTCVLGLALAAGLVVAASARATFPGRNGLIAFNSEVAAEEQIFVMNPDGSGLKQITHVTAGTQWGAEEPSISPDGRTIVFVQWIGNTVEIRAMTTTGADSRHLATGQCEDPSFSPDGKQVVFVLHGQIWVMNADGTQQRRLTAFTAAEINAMGILSPSYSPDGRTIVFATSLWHDTHSPGNHCEILAMNADGSHLRRLAFTTEADYPGGTTWGVSFSPDGKTIVYGAHTSKDGFLVRLMNADGSNQRTLPRSYGFIWPSFSPDGRQILCVNGHHQVSVVNADGTHWRRLTHVAGGVYYLYTNAPSWGPHVR
jgi:TolB protein